MAKSSDNAALTERVENLQNRVDSIHDQQRELKKEFTEHDKHCAKNWAENWTKLNAIVWGLRTIGAGVIVLALRAAFEFFKTM